MAEQEHEHEQRFQCALPDGVAAVQAGGREDDARSSRPSGPVQEILLIIGPGQRLVLDRNDARDASVLDRLRAAAGPVKLTVFGNGIDPLDLAALQNLHLSARTAAIVWAHRMTGPSFTQHHVVVDANGCLPTTQVAAMLTDLGVAAVDYFVCGAGMAATDVAAMPELFRNGDVEFHFTGGSQSSQMAINASDIEKLIGFYAASAGKDALPPHARDDVRQRYLETTPQCVRTVSMNADRQIGTRHVKGKKGVPPTLAGAARRRFEGELLHQRVYRNDLKTVEQLLATPGADVNVRNFEGATPLHVAASSGWQALLTRLLRTPGIDPEATDRDGETPLAWAAGNGETASVVQLLADARVDVNRRSLSNVTPLMRAAEHGHVDTVKVLLARPGIDVLAEAASGQTALHMAAENGETAVVQLLLPHCLQRLNHQDSNGQTAAHLAADNGDFATLTVLEQAGANLDIQDNEGWTARELAEEMRLGVSEDSGEA